MRALRWRVDGEGARDFKEGGGCGGGVVEVGFEGEVRVEVKWESEEE